MAEARQPDDVKLICGMITARPALFDEAAAALTRHFGPIDLVSDVLAFDLTHYYDRQMGSPLFRRFASFAEPVRPDVLASAKLKTNEIEADFARRFGSATAGGAERPINLDPGCVAAAKLVLASMKDFSHRIYLGRGVYAEVTLMYRKGLWQPLEWTFPDFASGRYDAFLTEVRELLRRPERKDEQT